MNSWHLLLAIGPLLLVAGIVHLAVASATRGKRVRTTGEIIGWDHSGGSAGVSTPTVRFSTRDGVVITRTLSAALDVGVYRNKAVPVWYDPADPERFNTTTTFLGRPGLLLIGLSVPVTLISWFVLGGLG